MPPARLPVPRGSTIVIENEKAKKTIMVHFYKISIIYTSYEEYKHDCTGCAVCGENNRIYDKIQNLLILFITVD